MQMSQTCRFFSGLADGLALLPMLSSPQLASHPLVESKRNCVSEDAPNPYLQ